MHGAHAALLPLFSAALFASALLAFWIQPLFTKLVLPRYGGSAAVWTTAAMFFQLVLLAGYLYAHVLARLRLRTQLVVHAVVVGAALATLPLHAIAPPVGDASAIRSLLAVLALGVGLPYFAISATAPLLQHWFGQTRHSAASDPYFLYAASNAGSLVALVGFPLLLEPLLGVRAQSLAWSIACGLFAAILIACGAAVRRHARPAGDIAVPEHAPADWRARARWMLLAFAPSSLMLGVTQHITSEIAAVPLLWIVPLTIYVLTYIVAFARRSVIPPRLVERLQPILVVVLVLAWPLNTYPIVLALHLVVFAVTAMMCHGELARSRPPVAQLTEFYLCLAIGGAAGGVFNALVAPVFFDTYFEYPMALAIASALRPAASRRGLRDAAAAALSTLAAALAVLLFLDIRPFAKGEWAVVVYLQLVGVALYVSAARPKLFGLGVFATIVAIPAIHSADRTLERHRSFFGVHTVMIDDTGKFNVLMHGMTIHGAQFIEPAKRATPTTYYHRDSGIADIFETLGPDLRRVAAVGMGTATLACYRSLEQDWTFFEIDPFVARLAADASYFTFLSQCTPDAQVIIGDGRLSLSRVPDGYYDLIVIDTFSSDSIPVHMITREALDLYLAKLSSRGVVVFHITNQYLDLFPVLSRLAADAGAAASMPGPRFEIFFRERLAALPSRWVAISRERSRFDALVDKNGWTAVPPAPGKPWTDDFSNVLGALK